MTGLFEPLTLKFGGTTIVLDADGGLFLPEHRLLAVADIHLEKGNAFARRGMPIPPYDTNATLDRLVRLCARHDAQTVVSMGDAFHDRAGPAGLEPGQVECLRALTQRYDWLWLAGNHDPQPWLGAGGLTETTIEIGPLTLVHEPGSSGKAFEIAGHLHPKARLRGRALGVSRPCFALDQQRLIMPAFGAYTGGLNVLDPAIATLLAASFSAVILGDKRLFRLPAAKLTPDPPRWQMVLENE